MPIFTLLTVIQAIVATMLVGVILMQKSEGGGLGVGGSPAGLMSARGAADFLTRATAVLATLFVVLSIVLAALAVGATSVRTIDTTLDRTVQQAPVDPLGQAVQPVPNAAPAAAPAATPVDPLAGAAKQ